jgi:hypothetical protein
MTKGNEVIERSTEVIESNTTMLSKIGQTLDLQTAELKRLDDSIHDHDDGVRQFFREELHNNKRKRWPLL